jgi:hypothetical protein
MKLQGRDGTGTRNMSASNGKMALLNNTTVLTGAKPAGATIVDLAGRGTANPFETTAALGPVRANPQMWLQHFENTCFVTPFPRLL